MNYIEEVIVMILSVMLLVAVIRVLRVKNKMTYFVQVESVSSIMQSGSTATILTCTRFRPYDTTVLIKKKCKASSGCRAKITQYYIDGRWSEFYATIGKRCYNIDEIKNT